MCEGRFVIGCKSYLNGSHEERRELGSAWGEKCHRRGICDMLLAFVKAKWGVA